MHGKWFEASPNHRTLENAVACAVAVGSIIPPLNTTMGIGGSKGYGRAQRTHALPLGAQRSSQYIYSVDGLNRKS